MNYRYQIREIRGEFYVFCQHDYISGMWWWKKMKASAWERCADCGQASIYAPEIRIYVQPMKPFKTLEAAKAKVELFKKKTIIHECDKQPSGALVIMVKNKLYE